MTRPNKLVLTAAQFNPVARWHVPLPGSFVPDPTKVALFDQNGYDLTDVEKHYAEVNSMPAKAHRSHRHALKYEWLVQHYQESGAMLNHALLFERKGYDGEALEQLLQFADVYPIFWKIIRMRPKWGFDFSMDYCDREGNAFEVLHYEFDGFDLNEVEERKLEYERFFASVDWDDAGKEILKRKDEWISLDFFGQSDYKCNYFGIGKERFKLVIWE
jgi:hypothetical protein